MNVEEGLPELLGHPRSEGYRLQDCSVSTVEEVQRFGLEGNGADLVKHSQSLKDTISVGAQLNSGSNRVQLLCLFQDNGRLNPPVMKRKRCAQPPETRADDNNTSHRALPVGTTIKGTLNISPNSRIAEVESLIK
jgi:hypothetical protein